jgi:hypothetical protein
MPKLSKRTVDTIRPDPNGREVFVWDVGDGALKGFGVRMMPSGIASYLVQYRTKEGRTRRLAIGKVGVLTPDEARTVAGEKLKEAAKSGDPSAERHRVRREALTIAELTDLDLCTSRGRAKGLLTALSGRPALHLPGSGFAPKQTPIRQQDGTREVGSYALSFANSSASRSWLRPARSLA